MNLTAHAVVTQSVCYASPHENLEDHTKVTSAVYGTGIAKGYVEKCATTSMPPEGHACYRVYLVLDPNVARNVYARAQPAFLSLAGTRNLIIHHPWPRC